MGVVSYKRERASNEAMQSATAPPAELLHPEWESARPVGRKRAMLLYAGFLMYAGLMVVAFYVGTVWLQASLAQLTLTVQDLKNEVRHLSKQ
jgi:hypothetical protein